MTAPDQQHASVPASVDDCLARMIQAGASDLFLRAGTAPSMRVNGAIVRTDMPVPSPQDMRRYLEEILTPLAQNRFAESPDADVAYTVPGQGRFRINAFLHQGAIGLAARLIPLGAIDFDTLNLPPSILDMADAGGGLVLIVGPTGCGKSTTLAALIHHINLTRREHIVTIEDPIEFVHEEIGCLIHQRQVGYDTASFATALRHVVRQAPDVVLIGEMRDTDTMQAALSAALTGHLVLTTLHTTDAVHSVNRMLNYFPADSRPQVQADLAGTLVGIVSMRLLPTADGVGRVPAVEILLGTPTVRRCIGEGRFVELYDLIKRGSNMGMMTMNQSLVNLCKAGKVAEDVALHNAPNREEFRLNMQGMYTGIDSIDMRTDKDKWDKDETT